MGQLGSAMQNPTTFQKDPQGFSGSEWGARFLGGGIKGLANGLQNTNFQPVAPSVPQSQFQSGANPVDPSYFQPQAQANQRLIKRAGGMSGNNLAFYGQGQ